MQQLLNVPLLRIHARRWNWEHALCLAALQQQWTPIVEQISADLASGATASAAAVKQTARQFRRTHSLISADEVRKWLAHWSLEVDDWMEVMGRWAARTEGRTPPTAAAKQRLYPEAICSGMLTQAANALARAAALAEEYTAAPARPLPEPDLCGLPAWDWGAVMDALGPLLAALDAHHSRPLEPQMLRARLASQVLQWTHVSIVDVPLASPDAAREALLCRTEDGLSIEEICTRAAASATVVESFIAALPPEEHDQALYTTVGQPIVCGSRLRIIQQRRRPSLDDPTIRAQMSAQIRDRHARGLVNRHVTWLTIPQ